MAPAPASGQTGEAGPSTTPAGQRPGAPREVGLDAVFDLLGFRPDEPIEQSLSRIISRGDARPATVDAKRQAIRSTLQAHAGGDKSETARVDHKAPQLKMKRHDLQTGE